ncbi:putative phosphatidylinositol phosphate kinase [Teratosphaeria destructans]|uniref:Phosphatidylinositol phosphate kinase n=1 Tax=Teratosphaeria destructans TaxID=418781 RepID=A0A9W7W838_9PEZI|nr:putative phosphatidylinositol phosphate kinase [Teratosphaeria destructans]
MPRRQVVIAQSIQYSITNREKKPPLVHKLPAYFYTYWLTFECVRADLFKALRGTWEVNEDAYLSSFQGRDALEPMGDMGYSGSTFFHTKNSNYLVKSIPRSFEHTFFRDDLMLPYARYMQANPSSLLVRITDFLQCVQYSIGTILGLAPSHHIVMENLLYGKSEDIRENGEGESVWEQYDLKPMSYFYPERDVAGGVLTSEATKSKLADDFNEKIMLTLDDAEDFMLQLEKDTKLLSDSNAVDYSLFLVRIPTEGGFSADPKPTQETPLVPPEAPSWRTGVKSADGKWIYRASILDFFWAKHKVHAKAMTGLINTYNAVDHKGPMSVTTEAPEYRQRFLKMCKEMIENR